MTDTPVLVAVPCVLVDASPDQNRETFDPERLAELAANIAEVGQLQPIVVRSAGARFVLVAGERRLRACRDLLGMETITAVVTDDPLDELAAFRTLSENIFRLDCNPIEEARGLAAIASAHGLEPVELARKLGKNPRWVRDRLSLLRLAPDVAHWVQVGSLPIGWAVLIADLDVNRQRLAVQARERGIGIDAYRALVGRLADEQAADTMFDTETFLAVEEYVAEAERIVELEEDPVIQVRETPLGIAEIAELLEVRRATVDVWRNRGIFPDPDGTISGSPYWWKATVEEFATRTGRMPS